MKKYEYLNESRPDLIAGRNSETVYLSDMGNKGWELVCVVVPVTGNCVYYWKREKAA